MGESIMRRIKEGKTSYRLFFIMLTLLLFVFAVGNFTEEVSAEEAETSAEMTAGAIVSDGGDSMDNEQEAVREEPDFTPVSEELIPLKTRIISISARNTPLKDVLYTVGENTGLNIVMERGVDPNQQMTVTLKEVAADEALDIIFASVDYFYELDGNVLIVKAMETRIFEFTHPSISQSYSISVGGDLLGAQDDIGDMQGRVSQSITATLPPFWATLEGSIRAIATGGTVNVNRMAGTIMVTASRKSLDKVQDYLIKIEEVMSRRVLIEARIVEVLLTDSLKYGIDWAFLDGFDGVGSILSGVENFGNSISVENVAGSGIPSGVTALPDLGDPRYFVATVGNDFSAVISALDEQGETEVLSNPRIGVLNGQTALLSVGTKLDFISEIDVSVEKDDDTGVESKEFDVTTDSILSGFMLGLNPSISSNGEVTLTVTPIVSELINNPDNPTTFSAGGDEFTIFLPEIDLKELSTIITLDDGEMIVIGGHIDKSDLVIDRQVPFLGSLPVIGYLFKSHENVKQSKELVIMLKTTVQM